MTTNDPTGGPAPFPWRKVWYAFALIAYCTVLFTFRQIYFEAGQIERELHRIADALEALESGHDE